MSDSPLGSDVRPPVIDQALQAGAWDHLWQRSHQTVGLSCVVETNSQRDRLEARLSVIQLSILDVLQEAALEGPSVDHGVVAAVHGLDDGNKLVVDTRSKSSLLKVVELLLKLVTNELRYVVGQVVLENDLD